MNLLKVNMSTASLIIKIESCPSVNLASEAFKQNLLELEPVVYTYQMRTITVGKILTGLWSAY